MNTFRMTGVISLPKETDKFKPYTTRTSASGWNMDRLRFNVTCGDNRHMISIDSLYRADESNDITVFTKGGVNDDGTKVKGESIKIPFKNRLTDPRLAEVAEYRKFVVDTEVRGRRQALMRAMDNIKEGKAISYEELRTLGVASEAEIPAEIEKSKKKRKEFISEKDFLEHMKKVIESGKYKDNMFNVSGNIVVELNKMNGQFYTKFQPNRVYLAANDAEPMCEGEFKVYYGQDGLDALSVEETGNYYLNGYTFEYNQDTKKSDLAAPITLVLPAKVEGDDKWEKIATKFTKYFTVTGDEYKEIGLKCNLLNGAQRKDLDLDDLDEETRENVELGLITIEDVKRELGITSTFGDRVQAYVITGLMQGFSRGANETTYVKEDFKIKVADVNDVEIDNILEGNTDEDDDI